MKLSAVMMVRNEADIIEAAVRHNVASLDRLLVIDHGSFDGTSEILRKLAAEDARLEIIPDFSIAYRQSFLMTQYVRRAVDEGADFVFALDADEFLKVPSRGNLEAVLGHVPAEMHVMLHWQTYVPTDFSDSVPFSPAGVTRRRRSEANPINKVVVARHFAQRPREMIAVGNHLVADVDNAGSPQKHARLPADIAAVAHVPVRSGRQLEKKIVIGYLAHMVANGVQTNLAFHWRDAYEDIRAGKSFDADSLREIAVNYGVPRSEWRPADTIELVEDPIAFSSELKYRSDADLDTLQLLMRFCERLVLNDLERSKK